MQICPVKFWQRCKKNSMEERLPFNRWGHSSCTSMGKIMSGWHHWPMHMNLRKLREIAMDREAWRTAVHGASKSRTRLSDWTTRQNKTNFDRNLTPYTTCSSKLIKDLNVKLLNFYVFFKLILYFYLSVTGLRRCMRAFSGCGAWASHRSDFSCCTARALGLMSFSSCSTQAHRSGAQALEQWTQCSVALNGQAQ